MLNRLGRRGVQLLNRVHAIAVPRSGVGSVASLRAYSGGGGGGDGSRGGGRWAVDKPEYEWRAELSADQFYVLRQKGTEPAFSGLYDKTYPEEGSGHFACAGCDHPLYSAASKFNSGCGWPAFDKAFDGTVAVEVDDSYGMKRVEIVCNNCGGHLGHVFNGEHHTSTNERHCVNSVSIVFHSGEKHDEANVPTKESTVATGL